MCRRATGPEAAPVRWAARIEAALLERWERPLRPVRRRPDRHLAARRRPPSVTTGGARRSQLRRGSRRAGRGHRARHRRDPHRQHVLPAEPRRGAVAQRFDRAGAPGSAAGNVDLRRRPACPELELDPRVKVHADVPALDPFLRRSKIAVAPLRLGTGNATKVLEAMVAGAAVEGDALRQLSRSASLRRRSRLRIRRKASPRRSRASWPTRPRARAWSRGRSSWCAPTVPKPSGSGSRRSWRPSSARLGASGAAVRRVVAECAARKAARTRRRPTSARRPTRRFSYR